MSESGSGYHDTVKLACLIFYGMLQTFIRPCLCKYECQK
jgi:hypothetical protein